MFCVQIQIHGRIGDDHLLSQHAVWIVLLSALIGALIGALLSALIGALLSALIGTLIGALLSALIGALLSAVYLFAIERNNERVIRFWFQICRKFRRSINICPKIETHVN